MRSYRAVAWDRSTGQLLIIPMSTPPGAPAGTLPVAVLRPNVRTRYGAALVITETRHATLESLQSPSLRVLSGRLR